MNLWSRTSQKSFRKTEEWVSAVEGLPNSFLFLFGWHLAWGSSADQGPQFRPASAFGFSACETAWHLSEYNCLDTRSSNNRSKRGSLKFFTLFSLKKRNTSHLRRK